jgi:L-threonylcarbamoyladenylate synthase
LDGGDCEVGVESTVVDGLHDPPLILRPGGVNLEEFRALGREIGGEVGEKWARTTIGYKTHQTGNKTPITNGDESLVMPALTRESKVHTPGSEGSSASDTNGIVNYDEDINGAPRAPGMKYRHYAPRGRLILFSEDAFRAGRVGEKLDEIIEAMQSNFSFHEQHGDGHKVKVGIISCHWPPYADLRDTFSATINSTSNGKSSTSKATEQKPDAVMHSVYADITSIARIRKSEIAITLYNVQLGPEMSKLAHSLFGVLRLFDDLDCTYIFAETVQRSSPTPSPTPSLARPAEHSLVNGEHHEGKEQTGVRLARRDLEDAVIDRIEKAAAERVD